MKSVWRPDVEIVVVDNFSTDGTWEILQELKKEYNIKAYKYRYTRGLGKHMALYKCPGNSVATWFDLDTVYNEAYHRAIDYALETGLVIQAGILIGKRAVHV